MMLPPENALGSDFACPWNPAYGLKIKADLNLGIFRAIAGIDVNVRNNPVLHLSRPADAGAACGLVNAGCAT